MKKIKTILAFALAISMCVSTAACGKSDGGEKDDTEEKVTTTAAESVSEETEIKDEAAESEAETEATTSAAEAESESEAITENISDIAITELEPYISEMAGKDIDTAEKIITDALNITSARTDDGPYWDNWMYYYWDMPEGLTVGGVEFDRIALATTDNAVTQFYLSIKYEDSSTALREGKCEVGDVLWDAGYSSIKKSDIEENPDLQSYKGKYVLSCGYADITTGESNPDTVTLTISDLH